jgi:D-alanyl-D-alanine carboxypeptidase (penicillin-binding protein 5/6)
MPPIKSFPAPPPPVLDAASWMLWSERDNAELGSVDPDTQRPFASITKLMTAILAVENADLDAETTISATASAVSIGYIGQADVQYREVWTMRDLLILTLVGSGNKASAALAEGVAGTEAAFVAMMNAKAVELGMSATSFTNPHGLDAVGHLSTPRDLITLGMYALQYSELLDIMRIKHITFTPGNRAVVVDSTNRLLGRFPGYAGLKTGDTASAGQVLVSYVNTGANGLLGVVLGSSQRRVDTRELMAWGLTALGPRDHFYAAAAGDPLATAFPDWYQVRIAAPTPLDPGPRDPDQRTPGHEALLDAYRELLPAILGGTP